MKTLEQDPKEGRGRYPLAMTKLSTLLEAWKDRMEDDKKVVIRAW
jgi:hypothetical protein